jgi:hypothetical protein
MHRQFKYYVVTGIDKKEFCRTVSEYLKHGWELQGGVSITLVKALFGKDTIYYAQTIVPVQQTTVDPNICPLVTPQ